MLRLSRLPVRADPRPIGRLRRVGQAGTTRGSRPAGYHGLVASAARLRSAATSPRRLVALLAPAKVRRCGRAQANALLQLQLTHGNAHVQRLLRPKSADGQSRGVHRKRDLLPPRVQREPADSKKITKLRGFLEADKEDAAISLMGGLDPGEKKKVLQSRELKELATSAFDNDEMYRAMAALRGDLYRSLEWMFDEGTDWPKVRRVIELSTTGKSRVRSDNWMKGQFVSICDNAEMAVAVKLLGGTLLQQLRWMKAEGSSWPLVWVKITGEKDPARKAALYQYGDVRDFFVSVCNDKEMALAVGLLGGTLLQQLRWMKAEGSNCGLVKARIRAAKNSAEKTAVYNDRGMREFVRDTCGGEDRAGADQLLGGVKASPQATLFNFRVTTSGCGKPPYVKATVLAATRKAFDKVAYSNCVKSASLKAQILSEFDGLNIDCEQSGSGCGMASRYFTQTVNIYPSALKKSKCDDLESTILHEVVHLTEWRIFSHGDLAYGCEKSCFGVGSGDANKCK